MMWQEKLPHSRKMRILQYMYYRYISWPQEFFYSTAKSVFLTRVLNDTAFVLTYICLSLDARLSSLDDFKYKKDELMGNLERMERELEDQQKEHKEKLYALDRKAVVDKDT